MAGERILIADNEKSINSMLKSYMQKEGFTALSAFTGKEALDIVKHESPDLIVLDAALPDISGIDVCLDIRKISSAHIVFLSRETEDVDIIVALSVGGDDYVSKPFSPGVLMARIKAHLRRISMEKREWHVEEEKIYRVPGMSVDLQTREVFVNEHAVSLTAKEFDILALLIERPRQIFSADQIFRHIWKSNAIASDSRTVMVYISTLRKKIESNPLNPKYVVNIRRVGYKFNHNII